MEKMPLHLKIPELQTSEEVIDAVEKKERLTGEDLPNNPNERIDAYMERLENIFLNKDERVRERNLEMLRSAIYDTFIIKPENVPESFFELQQRVARERGQPVENITPQMREQMIATIIEDQKASLDSWIDYLTSEDAVYPTWFKYFTFRNIVKLSQFDKGIGKFKDRTHTTTAPFPDIYREPLAQICDLYEQVEKDNKTLKDPEIRELFSKKFPTYYAELIQKSLASQNENIESIRGQWVKYEQGNSEDAQKLYKSLESKGTGWCTAGLSTAKMQIESGDFYVYYTDDNSGEPTQPRIAIRMNGENEIGEVRGILPHQNLEEQMAPVLNEKLSEFGPEADKYKKKSEDMKHLTDIEHKTASNTLLTKDDLTFLYETNSSIDGFGYEKDPRIEEVRSKRNLQEDLPVIFECESDQIAHNPEEIHNNTRAYIGTWNTEVLKLLPSDIEHIYTKFPEEKVFMKEIIPDKEIVSAEAAILKLKAEGHKISDYAGDMLTKVDWNELLKSSYKVISISVGELFDDAINHTYSDIKAKAQEIGLDLVPAALAPEIRLNYEKSGGYMIIAMNALRGRDGDPSVFSCIRNGADSWLSNSRGRDDCRWNSGNRFFFVRK